MFSFFLFFISNFTLVTFMWFLIDVFIHLMNVFITYKLVAPYWIYSPHFSAITRMVPFYVVYCYYSHILLYQLFSGVPITTQRIGKTDKCVCAISPSITFHSNLYRRQKKNNNPSFYLLCYSFITGDGHLEFGAHWIHGQEDNVVFQWASENGHASDEFTWTQTCKSTFH